MLSTIGKLTLSFSFFLYHVFRSSVNLLSWRVRTAGNFTSLEPFYARTSLLQPEH